VAVKTGTTDSLPTVPPAQISVNDVTQSGPTAALAEIAVGIFVVLTVLIWPLTYLGAHSFSPRPETRPQTATAKKRLTRITPLSSRAAAGRQALPRLPGDHRMCHAIGPGLWFPNGPDITICIL
jgi:hypothetical protein